MLNVNRVVRDKSRFVKPAMIEKAVIENGIINKVKASQLLLFVNP
jgi:hypothetical protein